MGILEHGLTRYKKETIDKAKALYAQGLTPYRIAVDIGLGRGGAFMVRRWCDDDFRRAHNDEMNRRRKARRMSA